MNNKPSNLLIVDDDVEIRQLLSDYLSKEEFVTHQASGGVEMREVLAMNKIDLILLDLMMPVEDGIAITRWLRSNPETADLPIIMVTAKGDDIDRIIGLEIGADDYVSKPFNPRELKARIAAVLRRTSLAVRSEDSTEQRVLGFEDWRLDLKTCQLRTAEGTEVSLTAGEFDLLHALAENAQKIMSRDRLLSLTQGRQAEAFDRSIDILVSRVRSKLGDDPKEPSLIRTVRGAGYILSSPVRRL
jgi:two-component system, OmpR family, response regulator